MAACGGDGSRLEERNRDRIVDMHAEEMEMTSRKGLMIERPDGRITINSMLDTYGIYGTISVA